MDQIKGNITANFLSYKEDSNKLNIPEFKLDLERNKNSDMFHLRSSILNADISGKINYETVIDDFLSELSVVFPSINKSNKKLNSSLFIFSLPSLFSSIINAGEITCNRIFILNKD